MMQNDHTAGMRQGRWTRAAHICAMFIGLFAFTLMNAAPAAAQTGTRPPTLTLGPCALQDQPQQAETELGQLTVTCQAEVFRDDANSMNGLQVSVAGQAVEQVSAVQTPSAGFISPTQWLIVSDFGVAGVRQAHKAMKDQTEAALMAIPDGDQVALIIVNGPVESTSVGVRTIVFVSVEAQRNALINDVRKLKQQRGAPLFDVLCNVLDALRTTNGPRAVLVLTDGRDAGSEKCNADGVLARAESTPVPMFVIGVGARSDADFLQLLADKTGGRYFASEDAAPQNVTAVLSDIRSTLRMPYKLTFTLPPSLTATGPVTVSVRLTAAPNVEASATLTLPNPPAEPNRTPNWTWMIPCVVGGVALVALIGMIVGMIWLIRSSIHERRVREITEIYYRQAPPQPNPNPPLTPPVQAGPVMPEPQRTEYPPIPPYEQSDRADEDDAPTAIYRGGEALATLEVLTGKQKGALFPIGLVNGDIVRVGRKVKEGDGNIPLFSPFVSGEHARVFAENGRLFLEDNGSASGTKVNGRKLRPHDRHEIQPGDQIEFANVLTQVCEKKSAHR